MTRDAEGALRCQGSLARLAAELGGGSRRALPDGRRPFGAAVRPRAATQCRECNRTLLALQRALVA